MSGLKELKPGAIFPREETSFTTFQSRRSVVHSTKGMIACTQPLAAEAGQRILNMGGNAADAAIAVAAAMNMTEPAMTGLGGDMFCLHFNATTKQVSAINGSGRSARNTTLAQVRSELGLSEYGTKEKIPPSSALSVTVPGAAAGWVDTFEKFGSGHLKLEEVLMPAIQLGEEGFPIHEGAAIMWQNGEKSLRKASPNFKELLKPDSRADQGVRAPKAGEIFRNPYLAGVFRTLAEKGKQGFYTGPIAQSIVEAVQLRGGHLEMSDLEAHIAYGTDSVEPISLRFQGQGIRSKATQTLSNVTGESEEYYVELWEHPPNGQGIVALMSLGILEELERKHRIPTFNAADHNTTAYLHALIEVFRIAFADAAWWVTDPAQSDIMPAQMLSRSYLAERAKLFDPAKIGDYVHSDLATHSSPAQNSSDTVYFSVVDSEGNGVSFVNSTFLEFGSCIIPKGCGFTLQNRASNFDLGPENHPNIYKGGKRPYHTIIPGLITYGEGQMRQLHSIFGVMGGLMQPQGHVQVLLNMEVFGMNPQQALDAPRICVAANPSAPPEIAKFGTVWIEEGISEDSFQELKNMGHNVERYKGRERNRFGRGQIIRRHVDEETHQAVYSGGSDGRGDGFALPC